MLESTTIITEEHLKTFQQILVKQILSKLQTFKLILAFIGVALILRTVFIFDIVLMILGVSFVINYWTFNTFYLFFQSKLSSRIQRKKGGMTNEIKNVIAFHDDRMVVNNFVNGEQVAELKFKYLSLFKAVRYKNGLYIYIDQNQAYIVFDNEMTIGSYEELIALLQEQLKEKFQVIA